MTPSLTLPHGTEGSPARKTKRCLIQSPPWCYLRRKLSKPWVFGFTMSLTLKDKVHSQLVYPRAQGYFRSTYTPAVADCDREARCDWGCGLPPPSLPFSARLGQDGRCDFLQMASATQRGRASRWRHPIGLTLPSLDLGPDKGRDRSTIIIGSFFYR